MLHFQHTNTTKILKQEALEQSVQAFDIYQAHI